MEAYSTAISAFEAKALAKGARGSRHRWIPCRALCIPASSARIAARCEIWQSAHVAVRYEPLLGHAPAQPRGVVLERARTRQRDGTALPPPPNLDAREARTCTPAAAPKELLHARRRNSAKAAHRAIDGQTSGHEHEHALDTCKSAVATASPHATRGAHHCPANSLALAADLACHVRAGAGRAHDGCGGRGGWERQ